MVVLLAAATTAGVLHTVAAHTVTHGTTSAAKAFVLWPAHLHDCDPPQDRVAQVVESLMETALVVCLNSAAAALIIAASD